MTCKKCNSEIKKGDRFCPICGEPVPRSENNKVKIIAGIAAVVIVLGAGGTFFAFKSDLFGKSKDTANTESAETNIEKTVLSEENTAETSSETGNVKGCVLDDAGNPVENAKIVAIPIDRDTNEEKTESKVETISDSNGNYELNLTIGIYKIEISANGYEDLILEKYVTVEAGKISEIEKISMKSSGNAAIDNIISHQDEWLGRLDSQDKYLSENNADYGIQGKDYIWFQDMDMDGKLEFVTMSKYFDDYGDLGMNERFISVYKFDKNSFTFYKTNDDKEYSNSAFSDYTVSFGTTGSMKDNTFNFNLWQLNDGTFEYLNEDGQSVYEGLSKLEFNASDNTCKKTEIFSCCGDTYNVLGQKYNSADSHDAYVKFINGFNTYFSGAIEYDTKIQMLKLSDYQNKSAENQKKILKESFNSWNYQKKSDIELPLKRVIDDAQSACDNLGLENDNTSKSSPVTYKDIYGSLMKENITVKNGLTGKLWSYNLCDYDNDGIDELLLYIDTGEGTLGLHYQAYDYVNGQVNKAGEIGETFEHLNEAYLYSKGNGIIVISYCLPRTTCWLWTSGDNFEEIDHLDDDKLSSDTEYDDFINNIKNNYCGEKIQFTDISDTSLLNKKISD